MKPKPFWPLNHFTVPIGISLLQSACAQNSRDHHAIHSILTMFLEEREPAGAFNKAQRLIECSQNRHFCGKIQGPGKESAALRPPPRLGQSTIKSAHLEKPPSEGGLNRTPGRSVFPGARRCG